MLTRNKKPQRIYKARKNDANANPQCFCVTGKNFMGNEKFQGNIYLKPEDKWFCIVNNMGLPYDLYEILSGLSFL